jgi:hypothetical protein
MGESCPPGGHHRRKHMSPRHNPEEFFALCASDDGTGFVDPADLAYELDRRDNSDACAMCAADDE